MTVQELIAQLALLDSHMEVTVVYHDADEGRVCTSINHVQTADGHYASDVPHIELLT